MHLGFSATTSSTGRLVGRADSGWRLHQGRVDSIGHSARSLSFERWAIRWLLEVQQVPLPELQRGQEDIGSKPRNLRQLGGARAAGMSLVEYATHHESHHRLDRGPDGLAHYGRRAKVGVRGMRFSHA